MKHPALNLALLTSAITLAGCGLSPVAIDPAVPVSAPTTAMHVEDARAPFTPEILRSPQPPLENRLGSWAILPDKRRVADLVASIVAVRWPDATVILAKFDADTELGVFSNTSYCRFTVHIETAEGRKYTVTSEGRNPNQMAGGKNVKIAIDRALEHFHEKIMSLP